MPQVSIANSPAAVATPVTTVNSGQMGLPMNHIPAGMMIPMPMAHMALPPHMQMGMAPMGLLRAPHMPGKCIVFIHVFHTYRRNSFYYERYLTSCPLYFYERLQACLEDLPRMVHHLGFR